MKFYIKCLTVLFILSLPAFASASVIINEIAWMGNAESSTNEWIELANTSGTAVDVSDYTLIAEDGTPSITLSGSIAPLGYYLIERTDDTTVPGVAADLIASFGSGISNGGETLRLKDASGNVIDTVVGGANWVNVGGDNITKETAQRSGNSWVTAPPTPRASNGGGVAATQTVIAPSSTSSPSLSAAPPPSKYPRANMTLEAKETDPLFVGFSLQFTGHALGLYDESLPYASYRWNWGDGSTGIGATTTHTYRHAGEYVVTFEAVNGQLHSLLRLNVAVTLPEITIDKIISGDDGALFLRNTSSRDVDLSGWKLSEEGGGTFVIPEHTFLLSGKTLVLGNEVTRLARTGEQNIVLTYPNGTEATVSVPLRTQVSGSSTPIIQKPVSSSKTFSPENQKDTSRSGQIRILDASSTALPATTVLWDGGKNIKPNEAPISSGSMKWWILFGGAVLLCLIGVVALRGGTEPQFAKEYAVIEEIDDGEGDL